MTASPIFIGIHGGVIALDGASGQELWKASLKGGDFVNVLVDSDRIIATTKGEVFCLDSATGRVLWNNRLPGEGLGIASIATASGSTSPLPGEKKRRDNASANAGA